ncbi:2-oxoglutarate and iron-dependent oxygenase domain-containing protein ICU11-like isoform X2 [Populus alba x Populus x berolinensis]|uniref:2-oxoglutarate and iron-dependent oxygenase domain-containing protein ICU11-like isoform X2 n=1 Tax=Populus alba x Populus x berolinensis TaxID=444605 RepID=A0AAD6MAW0_9ROSI|nr:2-oxoglutarate and iron-dependent oxygenase domain-containing protein ICU11-like isoform X2 [Populus alba x Populus x berolinensis]
MLEKLMDDYLCPMSRVLLFLCSFLGCGLTLDSHHGSVVEYREHMDIELGRKILIITTFRDEQFIVMVTIGHGARATISGHQVNLVIWCRSCIAFLLESCELDLILLLVVWFSVSVKVGTVCQIGCHIYVNNSSEKLTLFFVFSTFHFSFSTAEETSNDFSAGVEIVDPRKKKDNACQLLLRTGIAEEGWYIGILSH